MIEKGNLELLFKEIDAQLKQQDSKNKHEIIIYGGAALIAMGFIERATVDVDVFRPKLNRHLKQATQKVAKKFLLDLNWINSTGDAFISELPSGWESRVQLLFNGQNLIVKSLGRIDIIFTKFLAELDRGEDFKDLICLNPLKKELDQIIPQLKSLEENPSWSLKIDELVNRLLEGNESG